MTKELTLDEKTLAFFKAKFGEDIDPSKFYIFKCRAISNEPIHQNSIYDGATVSKGLLCELMNRVNLTDENIGIHLMHEDRDLNLGRVFHAELSEEESATALYADMAILRTDESQSIIERIENNVLDEVSVQFLARHAFCSKCHFDYMGEDATFDNWIEQTCPEGHTIGVDGCHLELEGVKWFSEISVVNRGAAHNAKILSQKKEQLFSEGALMQSLAASGKSPEILVATFNCKMEKKMDKENLQESLSASEEKVAGLEAQLSELKKQLDLGEQVNSLKASLSEKESLLAEKDSEITSLTEAHEAALAEVNEKLAAAEKSNSEMLAFLQEEVRKVAVAAGKHDVEIPSDLGEISTMLSENQQLLASLIPAGGVSKQVKASEKDEFNKAKLKSFQVRI